MKNLKTFESFSEVLYLWDDAKFWIEKLYPEEICFLAMYTDSINTRREKKLFPVSVSPNDVDLDGDTGKQTFEIFYEIPSHSRGYCTFSIDAEAIGDFTEVIPATHWQPSEGGETIIEAVEINGAYYLDSQDNVEADFLSDSYIFKSDIINKSDLISMMEYSAYSKVNFEIDNLILDKPKLPQKLIDKCEELRKQNSDIVSGFGLIKRSLG